MKIYLVQHGKAVDEKTDPQRPLTQEGRDETEKIARLLGNFGLVKVKVIYHSGKLRAGQTAEIFAQALKPEKGMLKIDGIAPKDSPAKVMEVLSTEKADIMIVGHLPHLSVTASKLISGNENDRIIAFKYSGVICLELQEDGKWAVVPLIPF